jgi:DNA-binding GntR family transcriptional regulator
MSKTGNGTPKRQATTSVDAFERLIEAILSGQIGTGSSLREAKLAREWGISRTPLREAVRRAAEAGFLVLRPNQAPLVRHLTANDIRDLYELRELLELHSLRLAWGRIAPSAITKVEALAQAATPGKSRQWTQRCLVFDIALHRLWMDACGNGWLRHDLERLYQFLRIVQNLMSTDSEAMTKAYAEHMAILEALAAQDQAATTRALRLHIQHARAAVSHAMINTKESS